jgi:CBS domain-containing protein
MRVSEVVTPNVERLPPKFTLHQAGMTMREHDIGAIPVYEGDLLIGMITDRDIAIRAVAEGKDPTEMTVGEAMSLGIAYCFEDEEIRVAGKRMREQKVHRPIVLDRAKRLVGIVSLGDLAAQGDEKAAGRHLRAWRRRADPRNCASPKSRALVDGGRPPERSIHARAFVELGAGDPHRESLTR